MARTNRPQDSARETELAQGWALSLAFANTTLARSGKSPPLATYADLVTWSQRTGTLGTLDAERLRSAAAERPDEAAAAFQRAHRLRSSIVDAFTAAAAQEPPPAADVETLNEALARALPARRLVPGPDGLRWDWAGGEDDLERMLWPIVYATAELLASDEHRWIRRCAAPDCRRFYLNHRHAPARRWCEPKVCGSRERARRHYRREKKK